VTVDQLQSVVRSYVNEVYQSEAMDLYDVLLYQYRHVQRDWTSSRAGRDSAALSTVGWPG